MALIKKFKYLLIGLLICVCITLSYGYRLIYGSNTTNKEKISILIHQDIAVNNWLESSEAQLLLDDVDRFRILSSWKKLTTLKAGYYTIEKDMSNNALVNKFRGRLQDAVPIRLENMDNMYEMCGRLGKKLQSDSASFVHYLLDPHTLDSLATDVYNIMGFIPPNTYHFNYTTTPAEFLDRMLKNYRVFWTDEKNKAAQTLGLKPNEVIVLASIVKAETSKNDEAPKIAGLYLNRLRIHMPLQSDPTTTYGQQMDHVDRVTNAHTQIKSAFNTYQFVGLPPGPINFPEAIYLNAVLNPESHDYIFMCAQPGQSGYHNFSTTLAAHSRYAAEYHKWLDQNHIR